MKIFITGGTGFIGTELVKKLSKTNHELYCLVRKTSNTQALKNIGAKIYIGDVTDKESILKGMKGCDWVVHLAGIYSFWEPDKSIYKTVNVHGTKNVMECALETNVSKVIHVSTAAVYGKTAQVPFTEDTPVGPVRFSKYAKSKYEGELIAWQLFKENNLPLVVIYPGGVLGAGDNKASGMYIKMLINRELPATAFNSSILTWVNVEDVANAIIKSLEKPNNIGEKYLIGKYQLTIKEFNNLICTIADVKTPKINLPDSISVLSAYIFTFLADKIRKPPLWGMAMDQIQTMRKGFYFNSIKAENELEINYTPLTIALKYLIEAQ